MGGEGKPKPVGVPKIMFAAGFSSMLAEVITLPLDTIKVRMQVFQGKYNGFMGCLRDIRATEGTGALWQGLQAGLMRQAVYATLRIAMFDYWVMQEADKKGLENVTLLDRAYYGILSGSIAMTIANPTDVVKVRFQAEMKGKGASAPRYNNVFDAFRVILKEEGMMGFYQSLAPNVLRNSVINAVTLASYSQIKYTFSKGTFPLFDEGFGLHLWSSSWAGTLAVVFGSPFDVTKSRVMNGKMMPDGTTMPYNSLVEAVSSLYKEAGLMGFYKGFNANCQRLVSWNVCMFVVKEQIMKYFANQQL